MVQQFPQLISFSYESVVKSEMIPNDLHFAIQTGVLTFLQTLSELNVASRPEWGPLRNIHHGNHCRNHPDRRSIHFLHIEEMTIKELKIRHTKFSSRIITSFGLIWYAQPHRPP